MKRLAIMQPYLFPYIGYFQLINAVDKFVVYDDVNFIKQGWINRNNILLNNKSFLFTVPVKDISSYKLICEMEISERIDWASKLLKTIQQSYKRAPYFNLVFPMVASVLTSKERYISKLALRSIKETLHYLGMQIKINESSTSYHNRELRSQERVLDICQKELASHYINPAGGKNLYSKYAFQTHNIHLSFLEPKLVKYQQFNSKFIPWLSILDVMMFNSIEEIKLILNQYKLQ